MLANNINTVVSHTVRCAIFCRAYLCESLLKMGFCATFVRVQLFSELLDGMALGNSKDAGDFVAAEDVC